MRIMVLTLSALAILLCVPAFVSAANGYRAEYVGGTVTALGNRAGGNMATTDEQFFVFHANRNEVRVGYDHINLIEYGQKAARRYVAAALISPVFILSKKREHFLTVGYTDSEGRQQAMVFRIGKDHIRTMLVTLEARTGLKVQYQDGEARKAGKG
jgi:hypothetical protein